MTEKETGNAQPGVCVDVLPRCWLQLRVTRQARPFSSPESVVSWSRYFLVGLQMKPSGSGNENTKFFSS